MFFAGLAQVQQGESPDEPPGFLIIAGDSDSGMLDVQDRRPVILTPELAREWLQPNLTKDRAKELAKDLGQPADDFEWYPVSKDVWQCKKQR